MWRGVEEEEEKFAIGGPLINRPRAGQIAKEWILGPPAAPPSRPRPPQTLLWGAGAFRLTHKSVNAIIARGFRSESESLQVVLSSLSLLTCFEFRPPICTKGKLLLNRCQRAVLLAINLFGVGIFLSLQGKCTKFLKGEGHANDFTVTMARDTQTFSENKIASQRRKRGLFQKMRP